MSLSNFDLKKYSKQIVLKKIGPNGQKKLLKSKVLIIGLGGLGCPLLLYLANSGIGELGIVDNDKIELSNLNRQILFNTKDLGRFKVDIGKEFIKKIDKKIKITIYKKRILASNIKKIIKSYDIICDGTDNFKTRYLINDYCIKMQKKLISAAISKFDGHLFNFNFKNKTACFRCFMPEIPDTFNDCEFDGVSPPVAGILGSMQASEVLNSILGISSISKSEMLIFNGIKMSLRKVKIPINKNCINKC